MKATELLFSILLLLYSHNYAFAQVPNYIPQVGLVGWWPFNGNAQDQTSHANHGKVNGATLTTDRFNRINSAYEFNGINNFIKVEYSESLSNVESITMSAWIYVDSMRNSEQGITTKWNQIMDCPRITGAYTMILSKLPETNNQTTLIGATTAYIGRDFKNSMIISEKQWIHVAFTHDNFSGGKMYTNGKLTGVFYRQGKICSSLNSLYFGADYNVGNLFRFFDGKLDDIAIWNRALTENEVMALYHSDNNVNNIESIENNTNIQENKVTEQTTIQTQVVEQKASLPGNSTLSIDDQFMEYLTRSNWIVTEYEPSFAKAYYRAKCRFTKSSFHWIPMYNGKYLDENGYRFEVISIQEDVPEGTKYAGAFRFYSLQQRNPPALTHVFVYLKENMLLWKYPFEGYNVNLVLTRY
jgi:hypothetical protein